MPILSHAIEMAMQMKRIFQEKNCEFWLDSPTNQQFVILPDAKVEELSRCMTFTHWGQAEGHRTICRFVTSWATTPDEINELRVCQNRGSLVSVKNSSIFIVVNVLFVG